MKKLFFALLAIGLVWQPQVEGLPKPGQQIFKDLRTGRNIRKKKQEETKATVSRKMAAIKTAKKTSQEKQKKLLKDARELQPPMSNPFNYFLAQTKRTMAKKKIDGYHALNNKLRKSRLKDDAKEIARANGTLALLNYHYSKVTELITFEQEVLNQFKKINTNLENYNKGLEEELNKEISPQTK